MSFSFFFLVSFIAIIQVLQCAFLIFHVFTFSHQIPSHTVFVSYFPRFSIFFPQSSSYSVNFSYLKFFTVSYHIPCTTVCVSHFTSFSLFLAIFHVLLYEFFIFLICQFSCHIPGPTVFVSHLTRFSVSLQKSRSYSVNYSFFTFFSVSRHIPPHRVFVSHFPVFGFSRHNPGPKLFLIFIVFHCFSPYSMSYSVCFTFCTFFSVSRHISYPTM